MARRWTSGDSIKSSWACRPAEEMGSVREEVQAGVRAKSEWHACVGRGPAPASCARRLIDGACAMAYASVSVWSSSMSLVRTFCDRAVVFVFQRPRPADGGRGAHSAGLT